MAEANSFQYCYRLWYIYISCYLVIFTRNHVNQIVVQTDSQASIECVVLLSTKAKDRNHTNMNNQRKITRLNCRNGGDYQLARRES